MLPALAHSMRRDHVHLWITFVFCSNTCVSVNITKTSPQHHATLSAFHAFAVHDLYSLSIARTCTIARMWPFSGQCERPGADLGGIECSSRYGQIFPIMDSKIVLGKNSPLIYFHAIHFCLKIVKI